MKFRYQPRPKKRSKAFPDRDFELVPYIPIVLRNADKEFEIEALVDSGSSHCIFPQMIGIGLGIEVERGPVQPIYGLGRAEVRAHFHEIELELGGVVWKAFCGFSPQDIGTSGLLGQNGFFSNFRVTFDRQAEYLIIRRRGFLRRVITKFGL